MNKILTASREIIKGNFGGAVKSLSLSPSTYRGNMDFFIGSDGVEHLFKWKDHNSSLTAYTDCPPVTAVINRKAQAHITGTTWVMNASGKSKGKEANNEAANKIKKLFAKPNPLQSWKEFEAQQKIYMQIFGYCWVLPIIPAGFESYGPIEADSMWNIPPSIMELEEDDKLFYQSDLNSIIKSLKLVYKGKRIDIKPNSVHLFKDFTPSFNTLLVPESRLRSLEMPINNIIGAFESRNVLINYRGALGILSKDTGSSGSAYVDMPWPEGEKERIQQDFKRYGLKDHQWQFIITTAALKWQQMGMPTKDLLLMEEVVESSKSICDGFGFPPHLLGLIDPTFNNQNAAEKGLYQNTIIPEAESIYEQWNNVFKTADYNLNIIKDFSLLPVLQDDMVAKANARKLLNEALEIEYRNDLITMNRWLELQGEDTRPDGDVYFSERAKTNTNEENNQGGSGGNQSQGQGEENENEQSGGNS